MTLIARTWRDHRALVLFALAAIVAVIAHLAGATPFAGGLILAAGPVAGVGKREQALAKLLEARKLVEADETVTPANVAKFETLMGEFRELDRQARASLGLTPATGTESLGDHLAWYTGSTSSGVPFPSGLPQAGGRVPVLRSGDRFASQMAGDDPGYGLGAMVRQITSGDAGIPLFATMSEGTPGGGGYLVPRPLAGRVIDRARAASRVIQAGALTIPMTSSTLRMARVEDGGPTAEWKAENAPATPSDVTLGAVEFRARTLIALVKLSVELWEDAPNADAVVETELAGQLATELDRAALRGSGSGEEPTGVLNDAGTRVINTAAGDSAGYGDVSLGVEWIRTHNLEPNALIWSPAVAGIFDRLTDTTGQPLRPPASFEDLTRLVTNQAASDEAYVGKWDELMIGVRTSLVIEASRQAADSDGSAFRNLQVWVRGYLRADVQVARPNAFVLLDSVGAGS